jgi:hypothetical protein
MSHRKHNSRLLRVPLITACIGVLGLAGLAGSADAATQIGKVVVDPTPGAGCMFCATAQLTVNPSATYAMPTDGVLTSWRFRANGQAGTAHLRVYRPAATPGQFELVAKTPDHPFALDEEATVPARVPVKADDRIGVGVAGPAGVVLTSDYNDHTGAFDFFAPVGSVAGTSPTGGHRVNIAATLEPDADKDGFGDESQDGCPSDPATRATCAAPPPAVDTSAPILALAAPRKESVKQRRLHVYAKSNDAAAGVVTGRVRIGRSAKSYRLRQANPSLAAGSRTKIVVRIPKRALLAIRAALRTARKPNARLTLVARDSAGNTTKAVKKIRLVR